MSFDDAELLKEFVIESREHLSDVENQLLTLESQGDAMDVSLVNTVFRAVHSIKGAAGFMGLDTLQGLAHREEEVLNKLRNKELRPTSVVINTLLRASDRLKGLLDCIETSNEEDVSENIEALERILNGGLESEPTPATIVSNVPSATPGPELSGEALREFLVESYDNLEQLERDLVKLERASTSEEILNGVFRNIHTIKGTSGFLGFTKLERLTHVSENLLGSVREGQILMDAEISATLFEMIDAVRFMLDSIEHQGHEGDADRQGLLDKLTSLLEHKLGSAQAGDRSEPTAKKARTRKAVVAKVAPKAAPKALASLTTASIDPVAGVAQPVKASAPFVAPANASEPVAGPRIATANPPRVERPEAAKPAASGETSVADSTIRVDVALLDKLMTCVGELVLARNQILQYTSNKADTALHATSQRLNLITSELQEGVMKTRMQPIGNVWAKFPRLVRDLAAICEKQVRIEMEGKETELDKTIIEAIKDPLTHLVRNTVDHGIERAEVRVANGKQDEGCLTLRAYHEGGQVNIEICDDGAGLNLDRIKAKAVERGLMTSDQVAKLADRDVGNLIFLPGFSTAEKVSNVSGRGVGMDVVKTNIEKIGGSVDLQSRQGFGTTVKIKIPLTLAIIPALIVTNDGNRYAIPQVNLLELVRLDGDDIQSKVETFQGAPVYRLRGRLLPLVDLRKELKTARVGDFDRGEAMNIVVLRADDRAFGLVVDRINDTEEIVVKPLSKQLKGIPVYSGTTIMGDGKVALILDIPGLAHRANVICPGSDRSTVDPMDRASNRLDDSQTWLVVGVGASNRCAVPLSLVTRLEKIERSSIESADGREVVQYREEILPLITLSSVIGIHEYTEQLPDLMEVIVYTENDRSIGVVVDRIIDIVDTAVTTKRSSSTACVLGSAVIQHHVTDLLDLPAIIRQSIPNIFE